MIKKGDFIELDYTAKLKDEEMVFDTTSMEVAKATGNFNAKYNYSPVIICVGEHHLIPGLDAALEGKELGEHKISISAENGFGKKRADLLKLIPLRLFKKDNVDPFPGLEVNIDGQLGFVKSVSGGRVIVDFNHPLSGKDLVYDVAVRRIVTDPAEQVRAVLELIRMPHKGIDIVDDKATVSLEQEIPAEIAAGIAEDIKRITGLKDVKFGLEAPKEEKKPESKQEAEAAEKEDKQEAEEKKAE